MPQKSNNVSRGVIAGLLGWAFPGAGHWFLGMRGLGTIYSVAVMVPFVAGVLLGGIKTSINPYFNSWLFLAELGVGGPTLVGLGINNAVTPYDARTLAQIEQNPRPPTTVTREQQAEVATYVAYYPTSDVVQIYLSVAGLLNLMALLDAVARAQTNGAPIFQYEIDQQRQRETLAEAAA